LRVENAKAALSVLCHSRRPDIGIVYILGTRERRELTTRVLADTGVVDSARLRDGVPRVRRRR